MASSRSWRPWRSPRPLAAIWTSRRLLSRYFYARGHHPTTGRGSQQRPPAMLSHRPSRPHGLLLPVSRHARFGAGEIAAGRLDVGRGLDLLEHLQCRPIGGNRFRQPLLVALAHAKLAQRVAEVVLGP